MSNLFECPICLENYNNSDKKAMSANCGHTFCLTCCGTLKNKACPNRCNVLITSYNCNFALMGMIESPVVAMQEGSVVAMQEGNTGPVLINTANSIVSSIWGAITNPLSMLSDSNSVGADSNYAGADVRADADADVRADADADVRADVYVRADVEAKIDVRANRQYTESRGPHYKNCIYPLSESAKNQCKAKITESFGDEYFDNMGEEMKELLLTSTWYFLQIKSEHIDDKRITYGGQSYHGGKRPSGHQISATGRILDKPKTPLELFNEFVTNENIYKPTDKVPMPSGISRLDTDRTFRELELLYKKYMVYNSVTNEFTMDLRLGKFIRIIADIGTFREALAQCVRPAFWEPTMAWLEYLSNAAVQLGVASWERSSNDQKNKLRLIAMIGPSLSIDGTVAIIKGFETGNNLINFSENASDVNALKTMMDNLSNPASYMTSQIAKELKNHNVSLEGKKLFVLLAWETKDDLDLSLVLPNSNVIYYGNKISDNISLDFDRNAVCGSNSIDTPVECISSSVGITPRFGQYRVFVNCYQFKNDIRQIPFTLTIGVGGVTNVYHHTWNRKTMRWGEGGLLCQTFTIGAENFIEQSVTPTISESKARSIRANTPLFKTYFGSNPKSKIAILSEAPREVEILWQYYNRSCDGGGRIGSDDGRSAVNSVLNTAGKPKTTMAERNAVKPLESYMESLSESSVVTIQMQKCTGLPAYATQIVCDLEGSPLGAFNFNALHDAASQTYLQPNTTLAKTGRLNSEWFKDRTTEIRIIAIVKWKGMYFCIVEGAKIPNSPVTGGFYPSDLSLSQHAIRTEYSIFNTIRPESPNPVGIPMIGFWIHSSHTVGGIFEISVNGATVRLQL